MTCPFTSDKTVLKNVMVFFYPEDSRISLPRVTEDKKLCASSVKEAVAECRGLQPESLEIFGVFVGSLENPNGLVEEVVPEDVIEVSVLRLSFDPSKEDRVNDRDPSARHMIFCELKYLYERGHLLPMPGSGSKENINENINDLLCDITDDVEREIIRVISRNFFTYTSRNYLVTCQRNLGMTPFTLSKGVVPIRIALSPEALFFFDVSGEGIVMYWPWETIITVRYCKNCMRLMIIYILVDEMTHNVLRPIFMQTSCNSYLLGLSIYIDSLRCKLRADPSPLRQGTCPYYLREFNHLDVQTAGVNKVESYLEVLAREMGKHISDEKLKITNQSLIDQMRQPTAVYVPRIGSRFEVVGNIRIRTITLVNEIENQMFKLQFMVCFGQKTVVVRDVAQALARYYALADSVSPVETFRIYSCSESVVQWLSNESVVSEAIEMLFFKTSKNCKPKQASMPGIPSKLVASMQRISLIDRIFDRRERLSFRRHRSCPRLEDTAEKSHPLSQDYRAPTRGSLAPSNSPERCHSAPPGGSRTEGAQNLLGSPSSPRRHPHLLLQDVAERLSKLVVPQDEAILLEAKPASARPSSVKKKKT